MKQKNWSWGNLPKASHDLIPFDWIDTRLPKTNKTMLPHGYGRSYGDVPINDENLLITTKNFSRIISFDRENGVLECEAGISFEDILNLILPNGWFLPVTPGTKYISLGGAIANDVHGKNHHCAGTFGRHIVGFTLLRSNGEILRCSQTNNMDMFSATIGGLGLTGLILSAEIKLLRISSNQLDVHNQSFAHLDQGMELFKEFESASEYTVAWIDCLSKDQSLGRGILSRASHSTNHDLKKIERNKLSIPFYLPNFALNKLSVSAFNSLYFRMGTKSEGLSKMNYDQFFYPLDRINNWNRVYGRRGFYQYQCVIPYGSGCSGLSHIKTILEHVSNSGSASFLAVLKTFGSLPSPGLMSFPVEGITLALDFPNKGSKTLLLMDNLDNIVRSTGGRVYPAKDARMSMASFAQYFPSYSKFQEYIDPNFSSSFWRRVFNQ